MIRFMIQDLETAIDLFQQDQSCHLMQEGQIRQFEPFIRPFKDLVPETQGTSDHETDLRITDKQLIELL